MGIELIILQFMFQFPYRRYTPSLVKISLVVSEKMKMLKCCSRAKDENGSQLNKSPESLGCHKNQCFVSYNIYN